MLTTRKPTLKVDLASDESARIEARYVFRELPRASDLLRSPGYIRREVADFKVEEELPFTPTDDGEHLLLRVRRSNLTTREVQSRLAREFHIESKDVGYIGLKDKRSIATQWFSVPVPTPTSSINVPDVEILQQRRHRRKLRVSDGCQNWFEILIREVVPEAVEWNLMHLVPNYFGQQRFGRDGRNAANAMKWIREGKPQISRFLKSIYISSLRSYVFNLVLARRVERDDWCSVIDGDAVVGDGFPTGPLWGRGRGLTVGLAQEIEDAAVKSVAPMAEALEWVGLTQERRSLVLMPSHLDCELDKDEALVRFALPSGSFATSVLHECFDLQDERN